MRRWVLGLAFVGVAFGCGAASSVYVGSAELVDSKCRDGVVWYTEDVDYDDLGTVTALVVEDERGEVCRIILK